MQFPIPSGELGTVTVLCGPNGSGKSFILRILKDLIDGGPASKFQGWALEGTSTLPPSSHRPQSHKSQMNGIGALGRARIGKQVMVNDINLKVQIEVFALLLESSGFVKKFDVARWRTDRNYRQSVLKEAGTPNEEHVYWLSAVPEFASLFEATFSCHLGVRHTRDGLELVMRWTNGVSASFSNWSDGQKSFFTVLATTMALRPEVYILDELENFMHPELISKTIEYLKRHCRQTILSTHHPHLIFGNSVDQVYYIESLEPPRPRLPERLLKYTQQPSPPRRIVKVDTDRAKLASAYRLFDIRDAALLASAAQVRNAVDVHLNEAIATLFECHASPSRDSVYMDRQTQEIAGFIASFLPTPPCILDWGAGLGRSFSELGKRVDAIQAPALQWVLYEPNPDSRADLTRKLGSSVAKIAADRNELHGKAAGLVLLTNVLHALDPEAWCDALFDAWQALRLASRGAIIITEIYPLLTPERSAIPVPAHWLDQLLAEIGFRTTIQRFAIKGAEAYCLAASAPPDSLTREAIREHVLAAWRRLHTIYLREYEGLGAIATIASERNLLNAVFGLARVSSCLRLVE